MSGYRSGSNPSRKITSLHTEAGAVRYGVAAMLPSAELAPAVFGPVAAPHQLFWNVFGFGTLAPCAKTRTPVPPSTQLSLESRLGSSAFVPPELLMKLAVLL